MKFAKFFLIFALPLFITSCGSNGENNQGNLGQTEQPEDSENSNEESVNEEDKYIPKYTGMSVSNEVSSQPGVQNKIKKAANQKYDFYVKAKQTFYIEIHLDNPSQYEILSFTLNDVKYQAYEFNKGSNSELLILEAVAPSTPGNKVYNLSSIKYVDGESIKDVDLSSAKRSVDVGISYAEMPTCDVINAKASYTTFDATLTPDSKDVDVKGLYHFKVYDDKNALVYEKYFDKTTDISIEKLEMESDYHYEVISTFDFLDGNGTNDYVIESGEFETTLGIELIDGATTTTSYSFDYDIKESSIVISNLYYQDLITKTITKFNPSGRTISGLYSDRNYKLFTEYSYNGNKDSGTIETDFKTLAKQPGTYSISSVSPTSDSVSFSLNISDEDLSTGIAEIALYDDETNKKVQILSNTRNLKFENLYSNHSYTIKITYYNNLNDGSSNSYVTISKSFKTYSRRTPSYSFSSGKIGYTTAEIYFNEDDGDGTGEIISFELYRNDNPVPEYTFETFEELDERLQNLYTNSKYVIKLNYKYDLNEGDGVIETSKTFTFKTKEYKTPNVSITLQASFHSSLNFIINSVDEDNVLEIDNVSLYENGSDTAISSIKYVSDYVDFIDLKSNTSYRLAVNYHYDLNDGNGVIYSSCYYDANTLAYSEPDVQIYKSYIGYKTLKFSISENTGNNTFKLISASILNTETNETIFYFEEAKLNEEIIINTLDTGTTYKIKVNYSYNLYDGQGVVTKSKEDIFTTCEFNEDFSFEFDDITPNDTNVYVSINLIGDCAPAYIEKIELIEPTTNEVIDYCNFYYSASYGSISATFSNLLSNHEYLIRFSYSLYHDEGIDEKHYLEKVFKTSIVYEPRVNVNIYKSGSSFVIFQVWKDGVADAKYVSINLYDESKLCQTITKFTSNNYYYFKNLENNKNYRIQVEYYYDVLDGTGYRDELLKSNKSYFYTDFNYSVNADVTYIEKNSANINLSKVSEEDSVITIQKAYLYNKNDLNNPIKEFKFDNVSNVSIELNNLFSGTDYVLEYYYTYRYRFSTDYPIITDIKDSVSFSTIKEEEPKIYINYESNESSISYNLEIDEGDSVGYLSKVELLDENDNVLNTKEGENNGTFNNLTSNTKYHLRATYLYALKDGNGERVLTIKENGYSTLDDEYIFNSYYYEKNGAIGTIIENNKLYAIFSKKGIGWQESVDECERLGGHLITTNEKNEVDILDRLLNLTLNLDSWIGGYYQDGSFHWISGEEFILDPLNFYYDASSIDPNDGDVLKAWFNDARYWYCIPYALEVSTLAYTLELDYGGFEDSYILTI